MQIDEGNLETQGHITTFREKTKSKNFNIKHFSCVVIRIFVLLHPSFISATILLALTYTNDCSFNSKMKIVFLTSPFFFY